MSDTPNEPTTTVVVAPNDDPVLADLADAIHRDWARSTDAIADAVDARLAVGHNLLAARERLADNQSFGRWFDEQGFAFSVRWAHTLGQAAKHEGAVRESFGTQVLNGDTPNFKRAVNEAVAASRVPAVLAAPEREPATVEGSEPEVHADEGPKQWDSGVTAFVRWQFGIAVSNAASIRSQLPDFDPPPPDEADAVDRVLAEAIDEVEELRARVKAMGTATCPARVGNKWAEVQHLGSAVLGRAERLYGEVVKTDSPPRNLASEFAQRAAEAIAVLEKVKRDMERWSE